MQPLGRKEAPGRPTLWVTTPRFLSQFGLRDLPGSHLTRSNAPGPARAAEPLVFPADQPSAPGSDQPL